jgi:hypothetical protein
MSRNYPKDFEDFLKSKARYVVGLFPSFSGKTWNALKKASFNKGVTLFITHYKHLKYHKEMSKKFNFDGEIYFISEHEFRGKSIRGMVAQTIVFDEFDHFEDREGYLEQVIPILDYYGGLRRNSQAIFIGSVFNTRAKITSTEVQFDGKVTLKYQPESNLLWLLDRLPKDQTEVIAVEPFFRLLGGDKDCHACKARNRDGNYNPNEEYKTYFDGNFIGTMSGLEYFQSHEHDLASKYVGSYANTNFDNYFGTVAARRPCYSTIANPFQFREVYGRSVLNEVMAAGAANNIQANTEDNNE